MYTLARRKGALKISAILAMAVSGVLWAQQAQPGATAPTTGAAQAGTPPTTQPLATTSMPGVDHTERMRFNFVQAPVSSILTEMSTRFGFIIVQPQTPVPGNINIQVPDELDADGAIKLLNNILSPLGFTSLISETTPTMAGDQRTVLRVVTLNEAKKSQIPVIEESDPNKIPNTDDLVTYVIPLKNIDAVRTRADLAPLVSADADFDATTRAPTV